MKILIAYFSWTGNTRTIAQEMASVLQPEHSVSVFEIIPLKERNYWEWLLLSFIPGSKVQIKNIDIDPSEYNHLILGTPKWTLSCPPINQFISTLNWKGKTSIFMTYGGFDEDRYLRSLQKRLEKFGHKISGTLKIKRREIEKNKYKDKIRMFLIEQQLTR